MARTTPPKYQSNNWKLIALTRLSSMTAREVAHSLNMPETTLSYHIRKWKKLDVIRQVAYGTWEVNPQKRHLVLEKQKIVKKAGKQLRTTDPCRSHKDRGVGVQKFVVVSDGSGHKVVQDSVATHGVMFVLRLPNLTRWKQWGRRQYLEANHIRFNSIQQGERLDTTLTLGWKVHLTNQSVVAYAPKGMRWYADTAEEGFAEAFFEYLRVIKKVESLLKVSLAMSGKYKIKTAREHHALIGNALAEKYTRDGEKLYVRDARGLWALIDASPGAMGEFETVRAGKDMRNANRKVQDFFNGVKDTGVTPQFLLEQHARVMGSLERYAENIDTHVSVMKEIRDFIREFREMKK